MTTIMINGHLQKLVLDFTGGKPSPQPVVFVHALADGLWEHGPEWIQTDEAKAVLQALNVHARGPAFKLDAVTELKRLQKVFLPS